MKKLLSIAGSDPSGGAGIQLDLKVFSTLGAYGMAIPTSLTVQNTQGVKKSVNLEKSFVIEQLKAVLEDIEIDGIKIGMLGDTELAADLAEILNDFKGTIVFDPVIRSTSGYRLTKGDIKILLELLRTCDVITPNYSELFMITGKYDLEDALKAFKNMGIKNAVITGADTQDEKIMDILIVEGEIFKKEHKKVKLDKRTHGTGCAFSSALLSYLVESLPLTEAYEKARDFVKICLTLSDEIGKGLIPVDPSKYLLREKARIEVLERLKKTIDLLKEIPGIYKLIPEVQTNLAEAIPCPLNIMDVAAFPGRIIRVKDKIKNIKDPEFGASSHVARIVLAANRFDKSIKSAINLKYKKDWIEKLSSCQLFEIASFSRKEEPEKIKEKEGSTLDWGVSLVCQRLGFAPDIIYDEGDIGKEPVIRVLGKNAIEVVNKVRKIAEILNL